MEIGKYLTSSVLKYLLILVFVEIGFSQTEEHIDEQNFTKHILANSELGFDMPIHIGGAKDLIYCLKQAKEYQEKKSFKRYNS